MTRISTPKVSSCVDCTTSIIGDRLRCPACHDQHAAKLARSLTSMAERLLLWLCCSLIVVVVTVLMLSAGRSCQ